ncbi:MAG TPA: DUF5522 domain-containing protein [Blastocatellia bacterium]|nr:DUF5522 domain-containing protein [Blastocatellia bacterium]
MARTRSDDFTRAIDGLQADARAEHIETVDYYWEDGLMVFTRAYHLRRGYCCYSGCRHCPYRERVETSG